MNHSQMPCPSVEQKLYNLSLIIIFYMRDAISQPPCYVQKKTRVHGVPGARARFEHAKPMDRRGMQAKYNNCIYGDKHLVLFLNSLCSMQYANSISQLPCHVKKTETRSWRADGRTQTQSQCARDP